MLESTIQVGDEVVHLLRPATVMKVVALKGWDAACEWTETGAGGRITHHGNTFPRNVLFKKVTTPALHAAIERADTLRREHNGIGGAHLFLGHDGHNECWLTDTDAKEVGRGGSGRSLLEAVERAEADWRWRRFWKKHCVVGVATVAAARFGDPLGTTFDTTSFCDAIGELLGAVSHPAIAEQQVVELLAAHPRIARLKGGCHWCLLPNDRYQG